MQERTEGPFSLSSLHPLKLGMPKEEEEREEGRKLKSSVSQKHKHSSLSLSGYREKGEESQCKGSGMGLAWGTEGGFWLNPSFTSSTRESKKAALKRPLLDLLREKGERDARLIAFFPRNSSSSRGEMAGDKKEKGRSAQKNRARFALSLASRNWSCPQSLYNGSCTRCWHC